MMAANLILASQSPRRSNLLGQVLEGTGITFRTMPAHVDETPLKRETPLAYVQRIAKAKALKMAKENPGSIVLAADTPVIVGRSIMQTPATVDEARAMLVAQSGRRVHIPTAVVAVDAQGRVHPKLCRSWVKYAVLTKRDIDDWLNHPDRWQVSGAMQIESATGQSLITTMHGSLSGILGLPLYETRLLLMRCNLF